MDQRPEPTPEGKLIGEAAADLDISIREAARRAGISYGRWRQVVTGRQNVSPGEYAAVRNVPARTLAKMALAVGLTPEQMETEGQRPDAAEEMRAMPAREREADAEVIPLPVPADSLVKDLADARLADIEDALGSPVDVHDKVERAIIGQHKPPRQIAAELREWRRFRSNPAEGRGASGGR